MAGYATPAWTNNAAPAINAAAMTAIGQAIEIAEHPYGVCSTGGSTAAKTVTVDFSGTLTLFTGLKVRVKFQNANTASSPTLNVNNTGARALYFSGSALAGSWLANAVVDFVYDGTYWVMQTPAIDTAPNSAHTKNVITSAALASVILVVDIASFSTLPKTVSNAAITANHVVLESVLGTPGAQIGSWTVTTGTGTLTISGKISDSTTLKLILGKPGTTI